MSTDGGNVVRVEALLEQLERNGMLETLDDPRSSMAQLLDALWGADVEDMPDVRDDPVLTALREAETSDPSTMIIVRRFPVPSGRLFHAFTAADEIARWWRPTGYETAGVECDAREGGRLRVTLIPPRGGVLHVAGTFREVAPPERLRFTWRWEEAELGEMQVQVRFLPLRDGTELVLTHEGSPSEELRAAHWFGWSGTLERLFAGMLSEKERGES